MKVASDICKQGRPQRQNHAPVAMLGFLSQRESLLVAVATAAATVTLYTSKTMAKGPIGLPKILQEPLDSFGG